MKQVVDFIFTSTNPCRKKMLKKRFLRAAKRLRLALGLALDAFASTA